MKVKSEFSFVVLRLLVSLQPRKVNSCQQSGSPHRAAITHSHKKMEYINNKKMPQDNNSFSASTSAEDKALHEESKKARKNYTGMIILGIAVILLAAGVAWLAYQLVDKQKENEELL